MYISGLDGPNIRINRGYLEEGKDYDIRLESGAAYTVKRIHVVLGPYNGLCITNIKVG